jgi:hypothetical protein
MTSFTRLTAIDVNQQAVILDVPDGDLVMTDDGFKMPALAEWIALTGVANLSTPPDQFEPSRSFYAKVTNKQTMNGSPATNPKGRLVTDPTNGFGMCGVTTTGMRLSFIQVVNQ